MLIFLFIKTFKWRALDVVCCPLLPISIWCSWVSEDLCIPLWWLLRRLSEPLSLRGTTLSLTFLVMQGSAIRWAANLYSGGATEHFYLDNRGTDHVVCWVDFKVWAYTILECECHFWVYLNIHIYQHAFGVWGVNPRKHREDMKTHVIMYPCLNSNSGAARQEY